MRKIIYLIFTLFLAFSCAKDNSTIVYPEQNSDFSMITITSPSDTLSVDYGFAFDFTPTVTQSIESEKLEYKWIASKVAGSMIGDSIVIGNTPTLTHRFEHFGTYRIRLQVTNKDYSQFKTWTANVRVYDEGLFVVGRNETGVCNFAFARTLSPADIQNGEELKFTTDVLKNANPNYDINKVLRIQKRVAAHNDSTPTLVIYCEEHIYIADGDTFEIFREVNVTELLPGEKLIGVSAIDSYQATVPVFTDKGNSYNFSVVEFVFAKNNVLFSGFDELYSNLFYASGTNNMYARTAWVTNDPEPKIWAPGSGYTGFTPTNNTSGLDQPYVDGERPNEFAGYDILTVTQMNGNTLQSQTANFWTIATKRDNSRDIKIVEMNPGDRLQTVEIIAYTADEEITFKKGAQVEPNARYNWICYSGGSKVYCWYPKNTPPYNRLPVNTAFDLGSGKEVTAMAVSYDMKELYVAFYDNNAAGELKGGLCIYNASEIGISQNLKPTKVFEHITTRPIQVGYKARGMGKYVSY